MLDRYICECMVLIININKGIKESTCGYQKCNTSHILIYSWCVKVRESLHTQLIVWVNAVLNHIDTRMILLGVKILAWLIDPNDTEPKTLSNTHANTHKKYEILIINEQLIFKKRRYQSKTG